jgi:hypothetical protein
VVGADGSQVLTARSGRKPEQSYRFGRVIRLWAKGVEDLLGAGEH